MFCGRLFYEKATARLSQHIHSEPWSFSQNHVVLVSSQFNDDSLDWKDLSAGEITQRVTGKVQSGSICLFHNAALHTPEALPAILDFFQSSGYQVVPISQLILTGDYYMDHAGKQCPAETA